MNEVVISGGGAVAPKKKGELNRSFHPDNIPQYLTKDEVDRILAAVPEDKPRDHLLIYLLWTTGLRITEALSLKKGDIDFRNRLARITWLKKRRKKERVIPLHPSTAYELSVYTGSMNRADRVFDIGRTWAYRIVKKYGKRAGIEKDVSPHVLRHSFAVNFLKQRKNLPVLQKLLGHSNITTTMIYLNIVQSDLAEEIDLVEF